MSEGARPVIEIDRALEHVGHDTELLRETCRLCVEETPGMVDDVRAAVAGGDPATVERAAHRLKGSLVAIAAAASAAAALRIEQLGREGRLEAVADVLAGLEREIDRLMPELCRIAAGRHPSVSGESAPPDPL